jgi:hypothetical protein
MGQVLHRSATTTRVLYGFHRDKEPASDLRYRNLVLKQMTQMKNRISGLLMELA